MVTDPQTNKPIHKPTDRTDYSTLRATEAAAQCTNTSASLSHKVSTLIPYKKALGLGLDI